MRLFLNLLEWSRMRHELHGGSTVGGCGENWAERFELAERRFALIYA